MRVFSFLFKVALLIPTGLIFAGPIEDAKTEFALLKQYGQNNDPRFLELFAPDGKFHLIQATGGLRIEDRMPFEIFKQFTNLKLEDKSLNREIYEKEIYRELPGAVQVAGDLREGENGRKLSVSITFKPGPQGKPRVSEYRVTMPLKTTTIKSKRQFEFVLPYEWKVDPEEVEQKGADGRMLYSGTAAADPNIGLIYVAVEQEADKLEKESIEIYPTLIAFPYVKTWVKQFGPLGKQEISPLSPGDKDRLFFHYPFGDPSSKRVHVAGVVVRTQKRIYVIILLSGREPDPALWLEIAKTVKES